MKRIESLFRRIATLGLNHPADRPPPPGLIGWRRRVLHLGIAFGWMAKGGPYDDRSFRQRVTDKNARWFFRAAFQL